MLAESGLGSCQSCPGICVCCNSAQPCSAVDLRRIHGFFVFFLLSEKLTLIAHRQMEIAGHNNRERTGAKLHPWQGTWATCAKSLWLFWGGEESLN